MDAISILPQETLVPYSAFCIPAVAAIGKNQLTINSETVALRGMEETGSYRYSELYCY